MLTSRMVSREQELHPKKKESTNYNSSNKTWSQIEGDPPVARTPPDDDNKDMIAATTTAKTSAVRTRGVKQLVDYTKQRRHDVGSTALFLHDRSCPAKRGAVTPSTTSISRMGFAVTKLHSTTGASASLFLARTQDDSGQD